MSAKLLLSYAIDKPTDPVCQPDHVEAHELDAVAATLDAERRRLIAGPSDMGRLGVRGAFATMEGIGNMCPWQKNHEYECSECGEGFDTDPHLVGERIVCKRCHDLIQPQCPYCGEYIRRKKVPQRRSSFKCKTCGEQVYVEPDNWLYDSIYLNEHQAGYVGFVEQLDHWVFTIGARDDYERMRAELHQKFGGEPGIGDVIWGLMNESVVALGEKHNAEIAELRETFDGRVPRDMAGSTAAKFELEDLRELMKEFREFEREMKAKAKQRKKSRKSGKAG